MTTLLTDAGVTPATFRGRRLRRTPALRALVRETRLHPSMMVAPIFVRPGHGVQEEIDSMPGQHRLSVDQLPAQAERLLEAGVRRSFSSGSRNPRMRRARVPGPAAASCSRPSVSCGARPEMISPSS